MKFNFLERKVEIAEEIREYARKKIGKLDKYFQAIGDAHITFGKDGATPFAEITVNSNGMIYRSRVMSEDLYSAIDGCISAIERQIHKNKTRLTKKLHQNAFVREMPPTFDEPNVEEEVDFPILRTKHFAVKPMTAEEAILQMNLLGHQFFVFKNFEEGDRFSVVYRRIDGAYGLISGD